VKQANDRTHPLREFAIMREIENLKLELKAILPSRSAREQNRDELFMKLRERYPELGSFLESARDIDDLMPEQAARIVWGARQEPAITEKRVSTVLADLRDRILFRTSIAKYVEKHREVKPTSPEHKR
jgi:hypothetical protein